MAQQQEQQPSQQPLGTTNTFTGGMVKDPLDLFKKNDTYTHARNMTNMLADGQLYGKSAEPANIKSANIPYTPIGFIYLSDDQWLVFSTNNTISEIGIFADTSNSYSTLMNDAVTITSINPATGTFYPGLNFKTTNLITGTARRGYDCGFDAYWSDGGLNPDRLLNTATCPWTIGAVTTPKTFPNPWVQNCLTVSACLVCNNTNKIDVEQLRLAPLMDTPCLKLSKGKSGLLPNGSYQVCMAYAVNSIKCTDYIAFSDVYSTFTHLNDGGSIKVSIEGIGDATKVRFTEMEIVVISMVNQQVQAKRLGIYSTNLSNIVIDNIDITLPNIPIEKLPLASPAIVSSDAIYSISNYLTRVGPKERPDFNYQPLANNIVTYWTTVKYPEKYYFSGGDDYGMNVGYMRGEVYAFYIRWVYSTGDKSASYVIPGRPTGASATMLLGGPSTNDSGSTLNHGFMEGWSSTEIYPDHSPEVWGTLCGQPIRWHKFPDQATFGSTALSHFNPDGPAPQGSGYISIMGVYFDQIEAPKDNNGNYIPDIVGYEILRAVRDGHQSIIAKGMVNNMRLTYDNINTPQLLANYPYNDLGIDVFLTSNFNNIVKGNAGNGFGDPLPDYGHGGFNKTMVSFHSPDTVFRHPYLGKGSLEITMAMDGQSTGIFVEPYKHPMFKVLTDFVSALTFIFDGLFVAIQVAQIANMIFGGEGPNMTLSSTEALPLTTPLFVNTAPVEQVDGTSVPSAFQVAAIAANIAIIIAMDFIQLPAFNEQIMNIIKGLIPGRQYALQYNSYGDYNTPVVTGRIPTDINDYQYIKDQMQAFAGYTINNLYRNDYVALDLHSEIPPWIEPSLPFSSGKTSPASRFNLTDFNSSANNQLTKGNWYNAGIGSYYASYKIPQPSQYGQIDSTKQVPIDCVQQVKVSSSKYTSPVMFGGDIYINRYTEKNPMMFFNDWLVNAPEDFKYDYRNYINVPYPMFWINNDVVTATLLNLAKYNRRLDGPMNVWGSGPGSLFYVNTGFFYLFCNGIRDFFVESSVNVGYRDWEDQISKRFYDPYGSSNTFINEMFRSDIIKSNTLYKYDYSLSASKFINQFISWSSCLRRDYDPMLAYTCFAYYPRRVAYSLPQEQEQMQDNWRIFLPNNYKDFNDRVSVIKDLHKSGALFLMESSAPMMFAGVETIASKSGTEYSVGTGLLFQQTLQSLTNVDDSYEHASCQNKLSVINTPYGAFWVSQKTGKLFNLLHGQLVDIGQEAGLKYHLLSYLPSQLLQQFPNYPLQDNPVAGVGVQLIYDSIYEMLYICKKDYKANEGVVYYNGNWYAGPCPPGTTVSGTDPITGAYLCAECLGGVKRCPGVIIQLGDPRYFEDASWTLSYDCRKKEFVSWHDWHSSLHVPSKNHFFTTNALSGQLWRHNSTTQLFANYYDQDYPVEIEYYSNTQTTESIIQSIEWLLESYQYAPNGVDKFLNYDQSFDYLMVYNKEQNSSLQNVLLKPWDNPYAAVNYPTFTGSTRQILYQKVENKYRVNDFYDFTADRGQFFTPVNTPMLTTNANGYTFNTNTAYFNLSKAWNQQKRIRYTGTRIFMRKTMLGKNSLTIRYANTKNQHSPR